MTNYSGLVLAAGFGTRLKPITDFTPKALVKYCGVPMLHSALRRYQGISSDMKLLVNTHYLSDKIKESLSDFDGDIRIFHEETILGTGGALPPMEKDIGDSHLIVSNADIVSDISLSDLIKTHERLRPMATMALKPYVESTTPVFVQNGQVKGFGGFIEESESREYEKYTFSAFSILSPEFRRRIPEQGESSIVSTYVDVIDNGGFIAAHFVDGFWYDVGTPRSFYAGHMNLLANLQIDGNFLKKIFIDSPQSRLYYSPKSNVISNLQEVAENSNISNSIYITDENPGSEISVRDSVLICPDSNQKIFQKVLQYNQYEFEI